MLYCLVHGPTWLVPKSACCRAATSMQQKTDLAAYDVGIVLDAVGEGASVEICQDVLNVEVGSSSEAGSKEEAFLVDVPVGSDSGDGNEDDANEGVQGERKVGEDMVDDDEIKENEGKLEGHETRRGVLKEKKGFYIDEYVHLWGYAVELISSNPGSTVSIQVYRDNDGKAIFYRLYDCLAGLKQEQSNHSRLIWNGDGRFEVSHQDNQHIVDLKLMTCTSREWMLARIPCCHSVYAMHHDSYDHQEYI
ncbi:hypothetical protein GOBAR_AA37138 [Gossypium barbadense]|uniref:Zinc finger PMZ-type domain-containing protein n=1 Tax=Gossypium barbadense TaxID=3634 RepID=A0A2P5VXL9_GOSBA|nr:hypothetical protein GOBAR_AA37138 [Gossypium barbadense]